MYLCVCVYARARVEVCTCAKQLMKTEGMNLRKGMWEGLRQETEGGKYVIRILENNR